MMTPRALPNWLRAAPLGFLGMVVLIAMVEAGLSRHELDFRLPIENQWRFQGRESRHQATRAEILCFGDSLVAQGVIPTILETRLHRPVYNLGMGGGQFPASYFFLRRALESGAKPSALVIDVLPSQLIISGRSRIALWANILDTGEAIEMAWNERDPAFLGSFLLTRQFTSIRSRLEIRRLILAGLNGSAISNRDWNRAGTRNLNRNQGALILRPFGFFQIDPRHQHWVYPEELTVDRLNGEYLERFLQLAESRRIPVFWVLTPVCPAIQAEGERSGTSETYARFVREVQSRHPAITIIDGRRSEYPESVLDDAIHLTYHGAAIFSTDLAQAMAAKLDQKENESRWVQLPRYRPETIEFRHEDLAESSQAVTATTRR